MERFFAPRRIAIAGASNAAGKLGHAVLGRLLGGPADRIVPIHPTESRILGLPTCPDMASVPEPVDLLLALVPGDRLLPLIESCAEGQVGYLLAMSSGFAEASSEGRKLQAQVVEAARRRGIRVVGPNSMGMLDAANALNASLVPEAPPGGAGFSLLTQSGGFGIASSMYAHDHQLAVAKICDLGNTSDIGIPDVLDYLGRDSETRVVGLYLEASGDSGALHRALSDLASIKPVVLTTPGRTEAGRRASLAHLGLPASGGPDTPSVESPTIEVTTGLELLDVVKSLSWQPVPAGPRAAILTATGGIGAELADLCIDCGLTVPELSAAVRRRIGRLLPDYAAHGNPIDITPLYRQFPEIYAGIIRILLATDEVDLLVIAVTDVATAMEPLAQSIIEALGAAGIPPKPVHVFWGSRDEGLANMRLLERARVPCYRSTARTVRAAASAAPRR